MKEKIKANASGNASEYERGEKAPHDEDQRPGISALCTYC